MAHRIAQANSNSWERFLPTPPISLTYGAGALIKGTIYLIGGLGPYRCSFPCGGNRPSAVKLERGAIAFAPMTLPPDQNMAPFYGTVNGVGDDEDGLYILGATSSLRYQPAADKWTKLPSMSDDGGGASSLRYQGGTAIIKNNIYCIGGYAGNEAGAGKCQLRFFKMYSLLFSRTLLLVLRLPPMIRAGWRTSSLSSLEVALSCIICVDVCADAGCQFPMFVCLFDGFVHFADRFSDRVSIFDTSSKKWSRGVPMTSGRQKHAAAAYGGKIYVFGGINSDNMLLTTVEIFDPLNGKWSEGAKMDDPWNDITTGPLPVYADGSILLPYAYGKQQCMGSDVQQRAVVGGCRRLHAPHTHSRIHHIHTRIHTHTHALSLTHKHSLALPLARSRPPLWCVALLSQPWIQIGFLIIVDMHRLY